MTPVQFSQYITKRLSQVSEKYDGENQHLYELGILIGMLSSLSYIDSQNFDLIKKQFDKIIDD